MYNVEVKKMTRYGTEMWGNQDYPTLDRARAKIISLIKANNPLIIFERGVYSDHMRKNYVGSVTRDDVGRFIWFDANGGTFQLNMNGSTKKRLSW